MSRESEREQLLDLRKSIAKREGQATYLVFNDAELEVLLDKRPKSIDELSSIKGFPKDGKRVAVYGRELVGIFKGRGGVLSAISRLEDSNVF